MSKEKTQNSPQRLFFLVVEQVHSLRCCLLRDIKDTRRRLFIDSERQFIAQETSFQGNLLKLLFNRGRLLCLAVSYREPFASIHFAFHL